MRDRIDDYNAKAERTIERCSDVKVVFAVVGDVPMGIIMANPEVAELLAKDAHEVLEDIVAWDSHEVDEAQAEEVNRIAELSAELKEKILADPRFKRCGNKTDRKTYARMIWDDEDFMGSGTCSGSRADARCSTSAKGSWRTCTRNLSGTMERYSC